MSVVELIQITFFSFKDRKGSVLIVYKKVDSYHGLRTILLTTFYAVLGLV